MASTVAGSEYRPGEVLGGSIAAQHAIAAGVEVDERTEEHEYGRFGWAVDPEGNRFELWEPRRS